LRRKARALLPRVPAFLRSILQIRHSRVPFRYPGKGCCINRKYQIAAKYLLGEFPEKALGISNQFRILGVYFCTGSNKALTGVVYWATFAAENVRNLKISPVKIAIERPPMS
jgi:hypothetical protein